MIIRVCEFCGDEVGDDVRFHCGEFINGEIQDLDEADLEMWTGHVEDPLSFLHWDEEGDFPDPEQPVEYE